ncbi:MAG: SGNH/GDSL hydrolase family protein [Verrucomicrobiota bacterium]
MNTRFIITVLMVICVVASANDVKLGLHSNGKPWGIYKSDEKDKKLPRVLLIGDSIVNVYRTPVGKALEGKAAVDAWVTGMHLNSKTLHADLKTVLAQQSYDVIHFNIGLHGWPKGRIPEGQYESLLKKYVEVFRKQAPKATLIWCSTTQISMKGEPTQLDPENNPTITKRNAIAEKVMKGYGIKTDDLYKLMSDKLQLMHGDKFHWSKEGVELQSKQVVAAILSDLSGSGK